MRFELCNLSLFATSTLPSQIIRLIFFMYLRVLGYNAMVFLITQSSQNGLHRVLKYYISRCILTAMYIISTKPCEHFTFIATFNDLSMLHKQHLTNNYQLTIQSEGLQGILAIVLCSLPWIMACGICIVG